MYDNNVTFLSLYGVCNNLQTSTSYKNSFRLKPKEFSAEIPRLFLVKKG